MNHQLLTLKYIILVAILGVSANDQLNKKLNSIKGSELKILLDESETLDKIKHQIDLTSAAAAPDWENPSHHDLLLFWRRLTQTINPSIKFKSNISHIFNDDDDDDEQESKSKHPKCDYYDADGHCISNDDFSGQVTNKMSEGGLGLTEEYLKDVLADMVADGQAFMCPHCERYFGREEYYKEHLRTNEECREKEEAEAREEL